MFQRIDDKDRNYVSDADKFIAEYDRQHPELSASQAQEIKRIGIYITVKPIIEFVGIKILPLFNLFFVIFQSQSHYHFMVTPESRHQNASIKLKIVCI